MPETTEPETDLLLTREEIQAVTNTPLSESEAQSIAVQATDAVRDYCGWRVAKAKTETLTLPSRGGRSIFLPTLHVNAITAVTVDGVALHVNDFDWDANGILERTSGRWPCGRRAVTVTLNHGYTACPGGISQAISAAVARGVLVPAGGIASETAIGQSIVYSRMSAGGLVAGAMFVSDELERLDRHRLQASR